MLTPGTILQNRYQILRVISAGGMGAVYLAQDLRLARAVVVKENSTGDPRQFQQEALLLANLNHPYLPRVTDHFVEANGAQYLVMDSSRARIWKRSCVASARCPKRKH